MFYDPYYLYYVCCCPITCAEGSFYAIGSCLPGNVGLRHAGGMFIETSNVWLRPSPQLPLCATSFCPD